MFCYSIFVIPFIVVVSQSPAATIPLGRSNGVSFSFLSAFLSSFETKSMPSTYISVTVSTYPMVFVW